MKSSKYSNSDTAFFNWNNFDVVTYYAKSVIKFRILNTLISLAMSFNLQNNSEDTLNNDEKWYEMDLAIIFFFGSQ